MESAAVFAGLHPTPGHHNHLLGPSRTAIKLLPPSIDKIIFSPLPIKVFYSLSHSYFSFSIETDAVL